MPSFSVLIPESVSTGRTTDPPPLLNLSDTNIAPNKDLFKHMTITPMETLIRGVDRFLTDPTVSGAVAEIHGNRVTIRPPHEYVDEDSKKNIETFWNLGYA